MLLLSLFYVTLVALLKVFGEYNVAILSHRLHARLLTMSAPDILSGRVM